MSDPTNPFSGSPPPPPPGPSFPPPPGGTPPPPPETAVSGKKGRRKWKKVVLIGGAAFVALIIVGAVLSPAQEDKTATPATTTEVKQTTTTVDPVVKAIAAGNVALCNDGTYSDNTDLTATCSSHDDVDQWLSEWGACEDGTDVPMGTDASCIGHGGFKKLRPVGYVPKATTGDVAKCNDGTFSDNTEFKAICSYHDGVAEWVAPYGRCTDGVIIKMSTKATCEGHDGFEGLLAKDYRPIETAASVARCNDFTYSTWHASRTCDNTGGVKRWLATYGQCNDDKVIGLHLESSCVGHSGFDKRLPDDFVPKKGARSVALCKDGTYANWRGAKTCDGALGIDRWLARWGECKDGRGILLATGDTCNGHGGFKQLLPSSYKSKLRPEDIAQCNDHTYSDTTNFSDTCSNHKGVKKWFATYAKCNDGTDIQMALGGSCGGHGGYNSLRPVDYVPPTTTTTSKTTASATLRGIGMTRQAWDASHRAIAGSNGAAYGPLIDGVQPKYAGVHGSTRIDLYSVMMPRGTSVYEAERMISQEFPSDARGADTIETDGACRYQVWRSPTLERAVGGGQVGFVAYLGTIDDPSYPSDYVQVNVMYGNPADLRNC